MTAPRRQDAGAAVGDLFARSSATGGLAGRDHAPALAQPAPGTSAREAETRQPAQLEPRVRLGVELTESQTTLLRSLGRPARTGGARGLGAKFTATGLLIAAIELIDSVELDMHGVVAGDLSEMTSRAREALLSAAAAARRTEGQGG